MAKKDYIVYLRSAFKAIVSTVQTQWWVKLPVEFIKSLIEEKEKQTDKEKKSNRQRKAYYSFEEYEKKYWKVTTENTPFNSPGLLRLGDRLDTLLHRCIGRDEEMRNVESFLADDKRKLWYRFGDPGCGKSFFVIQMGAFAQKSGWGVFYVNHWEGAPDTFLLPEGCEAYRKILIVWDNFSPVQPNTLKSFLELKNTSGRTVKLMVTSWQTHKQPIFDEIAALQWQDSGELMPIAENYNREFADHISECVTGVVKPPSRNDIEVICQRAEGHPQILYLALDLLLQGVSPNDLLSQDSIVANSFGKYINLLPKELQKTFWLLAFLGTVSEQELMNEDVLTAQPDFLEDIRKLHHARYLTETNGTFTIRPDLLRQYLCKLIFINGTETVFPPFTTTTLATALQPFLPLWAGSIWQILAQTMQEQSLQTNPVIVNQVKQLKELFLTTIQHRVQNHPQLIIKAIRWADGIAVAAHEEQEPSICRTLANCIGTVASDRHLLDIDWIWVQTLMHATVNVPTDVCHEIAQEIETKIAIHHSHYPEIDLAWTKALYNATTCDVSPAARFAIAQEIETKIANYHDHHPEIDLAWVMALTNATVGEVPPDVCYAIAQEIETKIAIHYNHHPEFDFAWAKALNSAIVGALPDARFKIANEIETKIAIHHSHHPKIDFQWAQAMSNASVGNQNESQVRELYDKVFKLAELHNYSNEKWLEVVVHVIANTVQISSDEELKSIVLVYFIGLIRRFPDSPFWKKNGIDPTGFIDKEEVE